MTAGRSVLRAQQQNPTGLGQTKGGQGGEVEEKEKEEVGGVGFLRGGNDCWFGFGVGGHGGNWPSQIHCQKTKQVVSVQCHVWHCTVTSKKAKRVCYHAVISLSQGSSCSASPVYSNEMRRLSYSSVVKAAYINLEIDLFDFFILNLPRDFVPTYIHDRQP